MGEIGGRRIERAGGKSVKSFVLRLQGPPQVAAEEFGILPLLFRMETQAGIDLFDGLDDARGQGSPLHAVLLLRQQPAGGKLVGAAEMDVLIRGLERRRDDRPGEAKNHPQDQEEAHRRKGALQPGGSRRSPGSY